MTWFVLSVTSYLDVMGGDPLRRTSPLRKFRSGTHHGRCGGAGQFPFSFFHLYAFFHSLTTHPFVDSLLHYIS